MTRLMSVRTASLAMQLFVATATAAESIDFTNLDSATSSSVVSNFVPELLPHCVSDGAVHQNNLANVYDCLQANAQPECFDEDETENALTLQGLATCLKDELTAQGVSIDTSGGGGDNGGGLFGGGLGSIPGGGGGSNPLAALGEHIETMAIVPDDLDSSVVSTRICLDPVEDCAWSHREFTQIPQLPNCLRQALMQLNQCALANGANCRDSCTNLNLNNIMDFSTLNAGQLDTCAGVQAQLVDASCAVVGCCEPCQAYLEQAMNCLVNTVLNGMVTGGGGSCGFTCPPLRQRNLWADHNNNEEEERTLKTDTVPLEDAIPGRCLSFAPGLTGQTTIELQLRSESFFTCVHQNYLKVIQEAPATTNTMPPTPSPMAGGGTPSPTVADTSTTPSPVSGNLPGDSQSSNNDSGDGDSGGGMSTIVILGIVVAVLVLMVLIVFAARNEYQRRVVAKKDKQRALSSTLENGNHGGALGGFATLRIKRKQQQQGDNDDNDDKEKPQGGCSPRRPPFGVVGFTHTDSDLYENDYDEPYSSPFDDNITVDEESTVPVKSMDPPDVQLKGMVEDDDNDMQYLPHI